MAARTAFLRAQLREAVRAEIERVGLEAFRPGPVAADFVDCGVGRTTLYRWISEEARHGAPEWALGRALAALGPVDQPAGRQAAATHLARLQDCADAAAAVMKMAHNPDGTVKHPRILLAAADQLRQTVDVAARVARESGHAAAVEAFMTAVADQVRLAPPEVARQVERRLAVMAGR